MPALATEPTAAVNALFGGAGDVEVLARPASEAADRLDALAARPKDRPGGKSGLKASAGMAAGKSKPWMGK